MSDEPRCTCGRRWAQWVNQGPRPCPAHSTAIDHTLTLAGHPVPRMPMGTTCACHVHREWVPIERHHVWPLGMGGPDEAGNLISVCTNAHYSIHEAIRQLMLHDGKVPAEEWRHFSAKVKRYAKQGWTEAGSPTHGGGGE